MTDEILKEIKSALNITDDSKDEIIKQYYTVVNEQLTNYIYTATRTTILRNIEKDYIISKMQSYNNQYNNAVEKYEELDCFIKNKYLTILGSYRKMSGVNFKNAKAVKEKKVKRGIEND